MDNNDLINEYCHESHNYAIQQALQKCIFELNIRKKLFNNNYTFNDFTNDIYCPYEYTKDELKVIYSKSKKIVDLLNKNEEIK